MLRTRLLPPQSMPAQVARASLHHLPARSLSFASHSRVSLAFRAGRRQRSVVVSASMSWSQEKREAEIKKKMAKLRVSQSPHPYQAPRQPRVDPFGMCSHVWLAREGADVLAGSSCTTNNHRQSGSIFGMLTGGARSRPEGGHGGYL